jgi:hypothetical protein
MRFADGLDHGAWPNDMLITVVDDASTLLLLLFVRAAWGLDDNGVPALEFPPDIGTTSPPEGLDRAETNARWAADWAHAFEVVAPPRGRVGVPDAATQRLLDDHLGLDELLARTSPESYWRVGLDVDAEWAWRRSLRRPYRAASPSPEHDAVEWLVPVWRSGLRTIVELPYAGYYAERIDAECAVVSSVTRRDPELYSLALSTF